MDNYNKNESVFNTVNTDLITDDNSSKPKKKKSKGVIIALVIALVVCVFIIIGLVILGIAGLSGVGLFFLNKTANQKVPEVTVVETVQATEAEATTEAEAEITTEPHISEVHGDYITDSEVTYAEPDYYGEATCYITYDTPGHAGVNLRETPEDDGVKIMVLPEGTAVTRLYAEGETTDTEYILVAVEIEGEEFVGYVMQRYVSTFTGASFDSYVSYETPDHAGLVLRETSSYYSEKILVLPEGTILRVVDNTTGAYWAVDAIYEGQIYSGYVLAKYIENY